MAVAAPYREYPEGYRGRRRYVNAVGYGVVAACYTYVGYDGRHYLQGDTAGYGKNSDTVRAPFVMRDIGEYKSPLDGTMITSRSEHREHMRVHDVIEVGNERMPSPRPDTAPAAGLGEAIKRRVEEVVAMPQAQYDNHVKVQAAEHAAVADLVTATPAAA
jgi:hypothetical protein